MRSALTLVGDQIEIDDRRKIDALVVEVEASLQSHDPHRLRKANAELDEGTQHLATLLIDRAMAGEAGWEEGVDSNGLHAVFSYKPLRSVPLVLIVIDTVIAGAGHTKEGADNDTAASHMVMQTLQRLARAAGCFVFGVDHFGKGPGGGP